MKHEALKSEEYKKAYAYIKDGVSFFVLNQYGERKWFMKGSIIYNPESLRNFFKLAYDLEDQLVIIPCAL